MTSSTPFALFLASSLALAGCKHAAHQEPDPAPPASPPERLFNGKDLSGWTQVLDSKWTVEEGVLLARQDPKGRREGESWLFTVKEYRDFFLTLKFRVTPGGNSGLFLRDPVPLAERLSAPDGGKPPWDAGIEANINATEANYPTGSLWEVAKGAAGLERAGEWNDLAVKVQGDRVWVWVNGRLACEARQSRTGQGRIGLQRHGTAQYREKLCEFKEIEIRELR